MKKKEEKKSNHSNILFLQILKEKDVLLNCENFYNYNV